MKVNTREIDKALNKWLKRNGYELTVFADDEFAYYYSTSQIAYLPFEEPEIDVPFMNFAKSLGLEKDYGVFILSFLHELGHHETENDLGYCEEQYCEDVKATLKGSKDLLTYFNLDDEKMATQWAVDFINENEEEVWELANALYKPFQKFYKKYGIRA